MDMCEIIRNDKINVTALEKGTTNATAMVSEFDT